MFKRSKPFLQTITWRLENDSPIAPLTSYYVPLDAQERLETFKRTAGRAKAWPVLLTRCGEDPGTYGSNREKFRPVAVEAPRPDRLDTIADAVIDALHGDAG